MVWGGFLFFIVSLSALAPELSSAQTAVDADFDHSGEVGLSDFVQFAQAFGSEETRYDLNGGGQVDFFDFLLFAQFFEASVSSVISPKRVFMKGNQWLLNNTGHQLSGFDMIRLSSYVAPDKMRAVTDTLNLELMIGIAPPYAAPDSVWAGDVKAAYPEGGALAAFESWIDSLKTVHNIPVSALFYNIGSAPSHTRGQREPHRCFRRLCRPRSRI